MEHDVISFSPTFALHYKHFIYIFLQKYISYYSIFCRYCEKALIRFTATVKGHYRDLPYHTWDHAFSVAHFMYLLLDKVFDKFPVIEVSCIAKLFVWNIEVLCFELLVDNIECTVLKLTVYSITISKIYWYFFSLVSFLSISLPGLINTIYTLPDRTWCLLLYNQESLTALEI